MFRHVPEENTSTGTTAKIHKVLGFIVEMYHITKPHLGPFQIYFLNSLKQMIFSNEFQNLKIGLKGHLEI